MSDCSPFSRPDLYRISAQPSLCETSLDAAWNGALFAQATTAQAGEIHQEQEFLVFERRLTPLCARSVPGARGWNVHGPGAWLYLPGTRIDAEWRGATQLQYLFLTPRRVEEVLEAPWERSGLVRWGQWQSEVPFVVEPLATMARDHEAGYPAGPLVGDALVVALLTHLHRRPAAPRGRRAGALGRRLDRVRDYVEANLARPLRLAELAAQAGVGVRQFGTIFAAETGWSPHRYVLHRRVERAKDLMGDPALSLKQIASTLGFTDQAQFSRVFRQYAGEAPSTFRRR